MIPQDTDACCRESAECHGKVDKPEPSEEGKAGGELWMATAAWWDSRGPGGLGGRLRSWAAGEEGGQRERQQAGGQEEGRGKGEVSYYCL